MIAVDISEQALDKEKEKDNAQLQMLKKEV